MRLLYINDIFIDIDNDTAIGIDLQTYDIKNPAQRKIKISNEFTIPITNNNLQAIGWIGGVQNDETIIYSQSTCNYFINNVQYINNSRVKVVEVAERISLYIYDKADIWDELKKITWYQFVQDYFAWLPCPKSGTGTFYLDFDGFIDYYTVDGGNDKLFLPITKANTFCTNNNLVVGYELAAGGIFQSGGAFMSYVKNVFEYLEDTYGINFYTNDLFSGNIWFDAVGGSFLWNFRHIYAMLGGDGKFYFDIVDDTEPIQFMNSFETQETRDKTLYDFVLSFFQHLNIMVQEVEDGFKLTRFDDLIDMPVIEFSGKITGKPKFKPFIDGYFQSSYIKFTNVESGISEESNARIISCLNENIDVKGDLFKINAFIPTITDNGVYDQLIPDLATKDSFTNFKFFIASGQYTGNVDVSIQQGISSVNTNQPNMYYAAIYSLDSEYTLIDSALNYPKWYEVQKWLTSTELHQFDFFRQYFIRELGGSFFINKIKGFNPELSRQAVTLEVFKISDQTPDSTFILESVFEDGVGNYFIDGLGNYYI